MKFLNNLEALVQGANKKFTAKTDILPQKWEFYAQSGVITTDSMFGSRMFGSYHNGFDVWIGFDVWRLRISFCQRKVPERQKHTKPVQDQTKRCGFDR